MMPEEISQLVTGTDTKLTDAAKKGLEQSIRALGSDLKRARENQPTPYGINAKSKDNRPKMSQPGNGDASMFTTISDMVNGNNRDFAGFGTLLDNLYAKNKKYFTIIKDYEVMPILIPQINRVLDFLVNECLSPDVQNEHTFSIRYLGEGDVAKGIQKNIDDIRREMKLDTLLREVYMNRYKLGREYYMVQDYTATFDHMLEKLRQKRMNEATQSMGSFEFLTRLYSRLSTTINEVSGVAHVDVIDAKRDTYVTEDTTTISANPRDTVDPSKTLAVTEGALQLDLKGLNIIVERSSIATLMGQAQAELLAESYSRFSARNIMAWERDHYGTMTVDGYLNESATASLLDEDNGYGGVTNNTGLLDVTKLEQLVEQLKRKKLKRCAITRFDPAKVFKLKIGGKTIGYFYVTDVNEGTSNMVNFAQSLKDQLLKTRATNVNAATQTAEEVISKELAQKIINAFDPNIGIARVEDIDLLHDFIRNNEIYRGNKRITFYYEDEIFDLSRTGESILVNAVFFTKLYATLLLNNIVTKVLRGRGRQIHTVKLGVSPNVRRYIDNAMASLAMPEHNLGTLHGSFEQIMNPFNGASDIVIPTEEDEQRYITTDYIPGQDVDMNDEFLRTLLNSIVTSFGLDSAVLDATNGNLQFARTLTMESLQIANNVKNEQQDLHDPWERLVLEVLRIMGDDATRNAVENHQISVSFFEPKTLIIQNNIEDLNNVKAWAEAVADIIPALNADESAEARSQFIYLFVKENTNIDFSKFEKLMAEVPIAAVGSQLEKDIAQAQQDSKDHTTTEDFGGDDGFTDEEREIMNMPDET